MWCNRMNFPNKLIVKYAQSTYEESLEIVEQARSELTAVRDDYWDLAVLRNCQYYHILDKDELIGFFAIDQEHILYQYFLYEDYRLHAKSILSDIIHKYSISQALIETYDSFFMIQAMGLGKSVDIHSNLYKELDQKLVDPPIDNLEVHIATIEILDEIVEVATRHFGEEFREWLGEFYGQWIEKKGIYVFRVGQDIVAIGELRTGFLPENTAFIGILVPEKWQNRGLGTYAVRLMKHEASKMGYVSYASVDVNNVGSNKLMEKAGFYVYHRIIMLSLHNNKL